MKRILALALLIGGLTTAVPNKSNASSNQGAESSFSLQEHIPGHVLIQVLRKACPQLEKCFAQVTQGYRNGSITVIQVDEQSFQVREGGGDPIVIVIDSF